MISTTTADALRAGLNTYGPLVTTMAVYRDFYYCTLGVYHYISGGLEGYHAIELKDYKDAGQYFKDLKSGIRSTGTLYLLCTRQDFLP